MNKHKSLLIDLDWLLFLLIGKEVTSFFGFEMKGTNQDISTIEINRYLIDLYQAGFVNFENKKAVIEPQLDTMIDIMIHAKFCTVSESDGEKKIFYLSNRGIVKAEISSTKNDQICIRYLSTFDLIEELINDQILVEETVDMSDAELNGCKNTEKKEVKMKLSLVEIINDKCEEKDFLEIYGYGIFLFCRVDNTAANEWFSYTIESAANRINQWLTLVKE